MYVHYILKQTKIKVMNSKTPTVNPNPLEQAWRDSDRLDSVQDTHAKIGEKLANHPRLVRMLGRVASKFTIAYENKQNTASSDALSEPAKYIPSELEQVAFQNHMASGNTSIDTTRLPLAPEQPTIADQQPLQQAEVPELQKISA